MQGDLRRQTFRRCLQCTLRNCMLLLWHVFKVMMRNLRSLDVAWGLQTRYLLFVVSIGDEDFYCIVAGMEGWMCKSMQDVRRLGVACSVHSGIVCCCCGMYLMRTLRATCKVR